MAEVKRQLESLLRIQELALEIQSARVIVEGAPSKIEEAEARFRERNAEYVSVRERYDAIEADRQTRSLELGSLEDARKKYQDSLMQVKNQREYAAVLKEIDGVKAHIDDHESTILKSMDEVETLKGDLEGRAAHIEAERAIVDKERADVESAVTEAQAFVGRASVERSAIEASLPGDLVANVRRVEEARRGLFLVKADREMCSACHVRIRPQVYQEIKQAVRTHICGNCKRYLYFEPALRPEASPSTSATDTSGASINC